MSEYRLERQAFVKLQLHVAKYPTESCNGLLIGEETVAQGFVVSDVVPLFHHHAPLAPLLEVACALVDTWCQEVSKSSIKKTQIVGMYQANGIDVNGISSLDFTAQKIADQIETNCPRACVLLVDAQQLKDPEFSGLQLLLKDAKRGWVRMDSHLVFPEETLVASNELMTQALQKQVQLELFDFDDHFEAPLRDWRNPQLVQLLQLNV